MKIRVLFMQRKESYEGEYGPEVLSAIDEFTYDENPGHWHAEVQLLKDQYDEEALAFEEILVDVDQGEIRRRLLGQSTIRGKVVQ